MYCHLQGSLSSAGFTVICRVRSDSMFVFSHGSFEISRGEPWHKLHNWAFNETVNCFL